jgi:hypothetical protein
VYASAYAFRLLLRKSPAATQSPGATHDTDDKYSAGIAPVWGFVRITGLPQTPPDSLTYVAASDRIEVVCAPTATQAVLEVQEMDPNSIPS